MSMFDTIGKTPSTAGRKANTLRKLERMNQALHHQESDRVPISDFFGGSFIERWRRELGLPADANPYRHYDLDWIVTVPNMDPWIRSFAALREDANEVVVRTGFGAILHKHFDFPVYGSMIEVSECLTRLIGQEHAMIWMGEHPERMGTVIRRIGAFYLEMGVDAYNPLEAKGGGYIFQSDHSVSSAVSGHTYDSIVKLVREHGNYPLQLGEFEEPV